MTRRALNVSGIPPVDWEALLGGFIVLGFVVL